MDILSVDLFDAGTLDVDAGSAALVQGPKGDPGAVYMPSVVGGVISWTNDAGLPNPEPADITGPQGAQGERGEAGPTGPQGPAGPQGEVGPQGAQGVQGAQGAKGDTGAVFTPHIDEQGVISWTNNGSLANPEPVSVRGPAGPQGEAGAQGPQGEVGPQGEKGDRGDAGDVGPAGPSGEKGEPGAVFTPSVDSDGNLSWTNNGSLQNPATVNIRGPQGAQGERGETGPAGPKGETGSGLDILGRYDTLEALTQAVPSPGIGDNYYVGEAAPYSIYTWTDVSGVPQWVDGGQLQGAKGDKGDDGGYYTPSVDGDGLLSWSGSQSGMPGVASVNIRGPQGVQGPAGQDGAEGAAGAPGVTFTPSVSADGVISWTNDGGADNPEPVSIRGPQGPAGQDGASGAPGEPGADGAPGEDGGYYTPSVSESGELSWAPSKSGMPGVTAVNIRGPQGIQGPTGPQGPAGQTGEAGAPGTDGADGAPGDDGGYYTPGVDSAGNLSWTASKGGMPAVAGANIRGPAGADGAPGADATINGVNALTLAAGENVSFEQSGSTLTISAAGGSGPMYVHFSGTNAMNLSADHTFEEVVAAYDAGQEIIAIYNNANYTLLTINASRTLAQFSYFYQTTLYDLFMLSSSGTVLNYYTETQILAQWIKFSPGATGITADNVQDAIEYLAGRL